MSNGKIIWTSLPSKALSLPGDRYLSLDNAAFNMGVVNFCPDALLYVDSTMADAEGWIAAKGISNLANVSGWHFFVNKTDLKLGLRLNDGDVTPTLVQSTAAAFALNTWFWARVEVDRSGLATFYVNAVPVGTGSVTAAAGSLDNTEYLKVGAYDVSTTRLKGRIGLLRIAKGQLFGPYWTLKEYDRLRYAWYGREWSRLPSPKLARAATEVWTFPELLRGASASAYEFTYNGGGGPSFTDGWPYGAGAITYTFAQNYDWGHEEVDLPLDAFERTLSGRLAHAARYDKEARHLSFRHLTYTQRTAIQAAHRSKADIDLYLDAAEPPEFTGKILEPPAFHLNPSKTAADPWFGSWSCDVTLEET